MPRLAIRSEMTVSHTLAPALRNQKASFKKTQFRTSITPNRPHHALPTKAPPPPASRKNGGPVNAARKKTGAQPHRPPTCRAPNGRAPATPPSAPVPAGGPRCPQRLPPALPPHHHPPPYARHPASLPPAANGLPARYLDGRAAAAALGGGGGGSSVVCTARRGRGPAKR